MNIADRALAAHEADKEAKRLRKEAKFTERKAHALDAISRKAEEFGVAIDKDDLEVQYPKEMGKHFTLTTQIDPDVRLHFDWVIPFHMPEDPEEEVLNLTAKPAEQLYWNLPPGQEKKDPGAGGSYGCNGLQGIHETAITTLAELGAAIAQVRAARKLWKKHHKIEEN